MTTVAEAVRTGASALRARGVPSAQFDAELLLAHLLGEEPMRLAADAKRTLDAATLGAFDRLLERRAGSREPVQYLTGTQEFYSLEFSVDRRVLIPRAETELLVEALLGFRAAERAAGRTVKRIADVGTGSGCIAVAVAVHAPEAAVLATDISEDAIEVARENARRHGVLERIEFTVADLLDTPAAAGEPLDAILSNPPYVSEEELPGLEPEVRDHEPKLALVGPGSGTEPYERLVPQAALRLRPGGLLAVEVSGTRAWPVLEMFPDEAWRERSVRTDMQGIPRVLSAHRRTPR